MMPEASKIYPKDDHLREAVEHGFSYSRGRRLKFSLLDRAGKPIEEHVKQTQGFAYAILACVTVYKGARRRDIVSHSHGRFVPRDHMHGQ